MNLQQVSLIAALVQADAALGNLMIVFRLLQLEHIHVGPLIDRTGVEQELVGRDAEQGLWSSHGRPSWSKSSRF